MAYVNVRGKRIFFEEEGVGESLVMVHGAGQDTLSWRFNVPFFSRYYRCIAVDLPGHGKSYLTTAYPIRRTEEFAEFVAEFLQAMGIARTILMGHSMSGAICLMVAANHPEMVKGVVCVDGAGYTAKGTVSYNDAILDMAELNPTEWFESNFRTLCGPNTSKERIEEIAFDVRKCAPEVAISDLRAFSSLDMRPLLGRIRCPVVLVAGEYDWSVRPASVERTGQELQCPKELVFLQGVGHFPHTEQPEIFNERVHAAMGNLKLLP